MNVSNSIKKAAARVFGEVDSDLLRYQGYNGRIYLVVRRARPRFTNAPYLLTRVNIAQDDSVSFHSTIYDLTSDEVYNMNDFAITASLRAQINKRK